MISHKISNKNKTFDDGSYSPAYLREHFVRVINICIPFDGDISIREWWFDL